MPTLQCEGSSEPEPDRPMVADERLAIFESIGKISPQGLFIYYVAEKQFRYFNAALTRLLNVEAQTLIKNPAHVLRSVIPDDIPFLTSLYSSLPEKKAHVNVEFRCQTKHESLRHLVADCYYLKEENGITGFVRDVTLVKQHENYIIEYGAKKDTLLEMVVHSLSSPIHLSKRVLGLMDRAYRKNQYETLSAHIDMIRSAHEHCIELIADFLKDEHFTSERIFVKRNRYNVIERLAAIVDYFRKSYPGRSLKLLTPTQHLFVTGDDVKFSQVINNLVSNAVKFTPANCAIEIIVNEEPAEFVVTIKDDGIGIPDHLKPLIFQRYTPAGRSGLQGEKSLGIGLSIVQTLVEVMKGRVHFESKENQGASFTITLPKEYTP